MNLQDASCATCGILDLVGSQRYSSSTKFMADGLGPPAAFPISTTHVGACHVERSAARAIAERSRIIPRICHRPCRVSELSRHPNRLILPGSRPTRSGHVWSRSRIVVSREETSVRARLSALPDVSEANGRLRSRAERLNRIRLQPLRSGFTPRVSRTLFAFFERALRCAARGPTAVWSRSFHALDGTTKVVPCYGAFVSASPAGHGERLRVIISFDFSGRFN